MRYILLGIIFICAILAHSLRVVAHGDAAWIAKNELRDPITKNLCCGPDDCEPLERHEVRETFQGWLIIATAEIIPHERVIFGTPKGRIWRCRFRFDTETYNPPGMHPKDTTRCLIMPGTGV